MHIQTAAHAFQTNGKAIHWQEFGQGHINQTLKVTTDSGAEYILQRINQYVFHDPAQLMKNACAITDFLRAKDPDPRHTLHFIPAKDGMGYFQDGNGEFWRMYEFVDGLSLDAPESEDDLYQSALAFGRFQMLLSDFPAESLYDTIPNFHNTVDRFRLLRESVEKNASGRLCNVTAELEYLFSHEELACTLQRMREQGQLPLRVTHNDTKLNNVLLDQDTREPLCVLDLDTVMPGLSAHDFGDSIRFGAATAAEDEKDLSKMVMDINLFATYTKGFLSACPGLTENERDMLPMGAKLMTLECGVRFLTDYLSGDTYFRTHYEGQNLDRCRTQFKLVADMESKWEDMKRIVKECE